MKPRHKISPAGIALIKSFEGYRRKAAQLPDGRWTIGYGHTKSAREGAEVSEDDATALLRWDLLPVTEAVNDLTFTPLTQNQFDALVSLAFNVGVETFRKSTVLRRVNEGAMLQAACSFEMWRKAEFEGEAIVVDALVRRRAAEKALFLTPTHGWVPAPSPVLRPKLDYDVCAFVPKARPAELSICMDGDIATVVREDEPVVEPAAEVVAHPEPELDFEAANESVAPHAEPVEPPPPAVHIAVVDEPVTAKVVQFGAASAVGAAAFSAATAPRPDARADFDLPAPPAADAEPHAQAEAYAEPAPRPTAYAEPAEPELFEHPSPPAPWPGYQQEQAAPEPLEEEPDNIAASADLFERPIYHSRFEDEDEAEAHPHDHHDAVEVQPIRFNNLPLVGLGLVGLGLFGAAMFWGSHAAPTGGLLSPVNIGVGLGLVGVGCAGFAGYTLLKKLGDREE
jgi:lysozyme